ncbi:FecR domain-containing protein [Membranicola marinus]|uniref:FecR domain-containing protein n=1 Tax=Membranihabitans marinus TaxID=1227546 RepID=A0A953LA39_9BACT|nr:FecR domain-containing protein [Membranihabitans marinus]MBY5959505.1 FecR domain-containing protein [Membranihabitans marinus]
MKHNQMERALLIRYFSGGVTPLEKSRVENWLSDDVNLEYFYEVLEEWERGSAQFIPDQTAALDRFTQRINQHPSEGKKKSSHDNNNRGFIHRWGLWLAVASILMLLMIGVGLKDSLMYETYQTGYGMTQKVQLADGSEVVLNANSSLRVSRWMNWTATREAWVTGEAYFSVKRTPTPKKFIVYTAQLSVEVLGTKFNIKDRDNTARVVLREGKVKVASRKEQKEVAVLAEEGDYAEMTDSSEVFVTKKVDPELYTTWKEKQLKFVDAPLPKVLSEIGSYYGNHIICRDSATMQKQFTGTLPNDDLTIILKTLGNIYRTEFLPQKAKSLK